ncbi:MAG TPA: hypothetical protein PKD24_17270, partial [Pyrinomonadaceae bacterium]|nr:hypothetical protein [Pyrinomonadaceae bacterium]
MTDTLGREVEVNYSEDFFPTTITQTWKTNNGSGSATTHTWATFSYTTKTVATDFDGLTVVGPPNGWQLKVLDKVTYPDQSYTKFHHNGYAQVWKAENYAADTTLLNSVRTDLETPAANQTDVPRFAAMWTKAANFNTDQYGAPQEIKTEFTRTPNEGFSLPGSLSGTGTLIEAAMDGHPYEAVSKTWYGETGWKEGLPLASEDWAKPTVTGSFGLQRWTWTDWTQDDTGADEQTNPRVVETRVGDGISTRKTMVDYLLYPSTTVSQFGLVEEVRVYDSDLSTVLKQQQTDYNLNSAYVTRRIIGLPAETRSYGLETSGLNLMSKATYAYDEEDFEEEANQIITPTRHDTANFDDKFVVGRGNLTSVTRYDVPSEISPVTSRVRYDIAGSMVARLDPLNRKIRVEYTDAFNDSSTPGTFAYPTKVYDPADNYSTVKYRFDIGANVEAVSPAPAGQTYGKTTRRVFDSIGRLEKNSVYVSTTEQSYVRYEYPTNGVQSKVYATLIDTNSNGPDAADEVLSESWTDGAGRVRFSRTPHTFSGGSTATWAATVTEYDILGRVSHQSVPVEVDGAWQPAGDDYTRGWLWTFQKYDWMGRVIRKIATDGDPQQSANDSDVFISYEGCGCAGGLVTTIEGELVPRTDTTGNARRKQKAYADILGRTYKTETYEWDGSTVYSTIVNTFNGRDQVTLSRQYAGNSSSGTYQDTIATFDGHGRLKTSHRPEQRDSSNDPTFTTYNYNADDSISSVVDARGAATHYEYNSRGLAEEISWTVPGESNIEVPTTVEFTYDDLGNRTQMTDGLGTVSYEYDELSRLVSETRAFSDTGTGFTDNTASLEYTYTMGGQLASYKLPFFSNLQVSYTHDKLGRLSSVAGTSSLGNVTYASNAQYRAWGLLKHLEYGNGVEMNVGGFNNKLQATGFEVKKNTTQIINKTYQYNADGMVKHETDSLDAKFDRSYEYDHLTRMTKALSGAAARSETVTSSNTPYRQTHEYNAFGQRIESVMSHWSNVLSNPIYTTWVNNRRSGGGRTFDTEGNLTSEPYKTWKYDAAGRLSYTDFAYYDLETYDRQQEWIGYDGDGRNVRVETMIQDEENGDPVGGELAYRLRSSILGGEVVYENGQAFVYAGGEKIATNYEVGIPSPALATIWHHKDPNMSSYRSTEPGGTVLGTGVDNHDWDKIETDGDGKSVGLSAPLSFPEHSNELYTSGWSFGSLNTGQYMAHVVDGIH